MLTDAELLAKTNNKNASYLVTVNDKKNVYPSRWINVETNTKKEAIKYGHEFALRILGLKRSDYYLLAIKK